MEMLYGVHELSMKTQDRKFVAPLQKIRLWISPFNALGNNDHT